MKKHLLIILLGLWVAIIPFLQISRGTTQTVLLVVVGLAIAVLGLFAFRQAG